jgi:hypothetical protein
VDCRRNISVDLFPFLEGRLRNISHGRSVGGSGSAVSTHRPTSVNGDGRTSSPSSMSSEAPRRKAWPPVWVYSVDSSFFHRAFLRT